MSKLFVSIQSVILASLALFVSKGAEAGDDLLLALSADGRSSGRLSLVLDPSGQISGLKVSGLGTPSESSRLRTFTYQQINTGASLHAEQGFSVMYVKLQPGFSPESGGNLTLTYTTNVFTGSKQVVHLQLVRRPDGDWVLMQNGRPLESAFIEQGNVGVEEIVWTETTGEANDIERIPGMLYQLDPNQQSNAVASISDRKQKPVESQGAAGSAPPRESSAVQSAT